VILYPRLERSDETVELAARLGSLSVEDCAKERRLSHPRAQPSPTGGVKATDAKLQSIVENLTAIAKKHGYPKEQHRNTSADAEWSEWLHRNLDVSPHEAAGDAMWHFLTLVLVPDLVRWRWSATKEDSASDRWVTVKHRGRNTFGRLWWRSEILRMPAADKPYQLVHELREDEVVQILERPSIAGHLKLTRTSGRKLIAMEPQKNVSRGNIMRQYQIRILRLGAFVDFQSLDEESLERLADEMLPKAIEGAKIEIAKKKNRGKKAEP